MHTSTLDVRLRLYLLIAIIIRVQSSYTVLGFAARPLFVATHANNPIREKTPISEARSAFPSNRLRFAVESSQSTTCSDQSSKHTRIKTKKMLPTILATLLMTIKPAGAATVAAAASSYHLTRILFLRMLAIVYIAAFSVAKFQNKGLIGDRGIAPARNVLDDSQKRQEVRSARRKEWAQERKNYSQKGSWWMNKVADSRIADLFRDKFWFRTDRADRPLPCLLWLANDRSNLNPWLDFLANSGLLLSTIMLATGSANALLIFALWLIQRSLMSLGGVFYGYGWEPQLAELTFHALFLVPFISMDPFFGSKSGVFAVSTLVIWAIRFYLFKIMLGAGLIKIKSSDTKWKPGNMSTMYYFYETQPVPNPFSKNFHLMPKAWHKFEVSTVPKSLCKSIRRSERANLLPHHSTSKGVDQSLCGTSSTFFAVTAISEVADNRRSDSDHVPTHSHHER